MSIQRDLKSTNGREALLTYLVWTCLRKEISALHLTVMCHFKLFVGQSWWRQILTSSYLLFEKWCKFWKPLWCNLLTRMWKTFCEKCANFWKCAVMILSIFYLLSRRSPRRIKSLAFERNIQISIASFTPSISISFNISAKAMYGQIQMGFRRIQLEATIEKTNPFLWKLELFSFITFER